LDADSQRARDQRQRQARGGKHRAPLIALILPR
jgi:hypothetical protein